MNKILLLIVFFIVFFQGCDEGGVNINHNGYSLSADIVVYGATSSGVIASIQAARMKKKVLLIVTANERIGGMTTNGLSNTDIGVFSSVGGLALEFYKNIGSYYKLPYKLNFEPKVALETFLQMLRKENITILYNENIGINSKVVFDSTNIKYIITDSGKKISGNIFIDASYEGDLMAKSNVSYIIGRESNQKYNETLNGANDPDLGWGVSVFKEENNHLSGLLPNISPISSHSRIGLEDHKIQPYNFRLCMTRKKDNLVMLDKPENYNIEDYELLVRFAKKKPKNNFLSVAPLANGKFDVNNEGHISTDLPGINYHYPDGNNEERKLIKEKIKQYIHGFIWTLQNDNRIPIEVREKYNSLGLAKDEFTDDKNWPFELYVREGRRMLGEYVMTEHDIKLETKIEDSIGMGSYSMDSHPVQYEVSKKNLLAVEGGIYKAIKAPYPISIKSILPKKMECTNLLVPVCLSASHVAYSTIRMEPVYMILGQSAAIAASLSIDKKVNLQDLNYSQLKPLLIGAGQKLY